MRNFISVFKLQLVNMFRKDKARSSAKKTVGLAFLFVVLYAVVAGLLVYLIYGTAELMVVFGLESEFIAIILTVGLFTVLIFGIVVVLTGLYFSKDTEFFLALPIKPSTVFAAKIAVVYLTELAVTVLLMLPVMITAGVMMSMSAAYFIIMPFAILFTPAIPLFFASIIAIPIMYAVSFFRSRGALGSVLVIVLIGALFAGYYVLVGKMQDLDPETIDADKLRNMVINVVQVLYPLYALAKGMTLAVSYGLGVGASVAVNLLIFLASVIAIGAIAMLISAAVYKRGASSQLEGRRKTKTVAVEYHGSSSCKALMKKEFREIIRTPAFALNCLLPLVLCPIVLAFLGFSFSATEIFGEVGESEELIEEMPTMIAMFNNIMRYVMFGFTMFMAISANSAAATAFSREGEKLYFAKIMPVDYATQIKAKSYVYLIIGSISAILSSIVIAIFNFDIVFFICSLLFLLIFDFAAVHFGMGLDLGRPKLKWVTPNEVMKHNRNVNIFVLVCMLVGIAFAVIGGVTYVTFSSLMGGLGVFLSWAIMFVAVITLAVLSAAFLYKDCGKMFEKIDL